jgi:hypothetical protein
MLKTYHIMELQGGTCVVENGRVVERYENPVLTEERQQVLLT